jgi:hypothetical protein
MGEKIDRKTSAIKIGQISIHLSCNYLAFSAVRILGVLGLHKVFLFFIRKITNIMRDALSNPRRQIRFKVKWNESFPVASKRRVRDEDNVQDRDWKTNQSRKAYPLSPGEPEILISGDDAHGVRMTLAATPALDSDDLISLVEHPEADSLGDTPLQTVIDVLLPVCVIIIRLLPGKQEWIDTAV